MHEENLIHQVGLIAAVVLPMFNIPLILRIIKRRSSADISLTWVVGVWICILLMAPSGFQSADMVWRTFNHFNVVLFTAVAVVALKFHKGPS